MSRSNTLVDELAAALHNGWSDYVKSLGFWHGPTRDDEARTHPDLKPFDQLSTLSRERERELAADVLGRLVELQMVEVSEAGRPNAHALRKLNRRGRAELLEQLARLVFERWARIRDVEGIPPAGQPFTREDWFRLSTPGKRDQDTAAVHGLLRLLENGPSPVADEPLVPPRSSVAALNRTAYPEFARTEFLTLERNELVPEIASNVFADILGELGPRSFSSYPAVGPLYEDLARHLDVSLDELVVGAGSDWIIRACFDAFCSPGDRVVLAVPTYGMYEVYAQMGGARLETITYSDDFTFPVNQVLARLETGPKIVGLASPNGALGTSIPVAELQILLEAARTAGSLIILDEAYVEFAEDRWLSRFREYPNMVLVRTFSKAAGLAGLRIGYAIGSAEVIGCLKQVRPNVEVNQVGVQAARFMLAHPTIVTDQVARTIDGREYLARFLVGLGLEVRVGDANFLHVRFAGIRERVLEAMYRNGVLVKDHRDDAVLSDWTRITAADRNHMERVAEIIRQAATGSE